MLSKRSSSSTSSPFSTYQIKLLFSLALLLFTVVLDFMLLPALSAMVLPALDLTTAQFGYIVSAYSFSAGAAALSFSAFADRFERKKLLLFLYSGFLIGIVSSAFAQGFWALFIARMITGVFGGVIAAICFSIVSEVFSLTQRGRAMGAVQMAFAFCQVLGLPAAVFIASRYSWQASYFIIFAIGALALLLALFVLEPLLNHLENKESTLKHVSNIIQTKAYWLVFSNNALLVTGDVLFMTFAAAYFTGNQSISEEQLALIFGASGIASLVASPLIGRLADKINHFKVFTGGTIIAISAVAMISNIKGAGIIWMVILNTLLFIGIAARMICSGALGLEIPKSKDRASFLTFDSALQQLCAGVGATAAGFIVYTSSKGFVYNYPTLSIVVIACMLLTLYLTYQISKRTRVIEKKPL